MTVLQWLAWAVAVPPALGCAYLLLLTLLSARPRRTPAPSTGLYFDVIVPAHNEEHSIARTVASLRALDWPAHAYRILVVADNCSDATAARARAAGAEVLEREDPQRRGKGYALAHAIAHSRQGGVDAARAVAVVVVDADSVVSPNLLEAFASRIERGADALQARYGALNARKSWRTRLIAIALGAFHDLRSRARERLGLSCGVRGNGWCVTHPLLDRLPYDAFSLAEDLEYGVRLALDGTRVHYVDEARVDGEMASASGAARGQRQRWEDGRRAVARRFLRPLLAAAIRKRSAVCLDAAIDLAVPPLAQLCVWLAAAVLLALAAGAPMVSPLQALNAAAVLALVLYVLRGWQLSGTGARGLADLALAPAYVAWKLWALLQRRGSGWVRTPRENV